MDMEGKVNLRDEFTKHGTTDGVYHFSGGEIGYTFAVTNGVGTFRLRYESGWYCTYTNDGTRLIAGMICKPDGIETVPGGDKRNIVKFEPLTWKEAKMKYPDITEGFRP